MKKYNFLQRNKKFYFMYVITEVVINEYKPQECTVRTGKLFNDMHTV